MLCVWREIPVQEEGLGLGVGGPCIGGTGAEAKEWCLCSEAQCTMGNGHHPSSSLWTEWRTNKTEKHYLRATSLADGYYVRFSYY